MPLHLLEAAIPLRDPFHSAAGSVGVRRLVFVGLEQDGVTGWGEAAPYPGLFPERAAESYDALVSRDVALPRSASTALQQAAADLEARMAGRSIGHVEVEATATCAIGRRSTAVETVAAATAAHEAGFVRLKIKVEPRHDVEVLETIRAELPAVELSADANGAYDLDDTFIATIDRLSLAYVEQPLAAHDLDGLETLANAIETPIALDESMYDHADEVIGRALGHIVVVKPGVHGKAAWDLASKAGEQGLRVKASGLIESSIGRAHTRALLAHESVTQIDHAPARFFLERDVSDLAERPGTAMTPDGHGIGFDPDFSLLGDAVIRRETIDW